MKERTSPGALHYCGEPGGRTQAWWGRGRLPGEAGGRSCRSRRAPWLPASTSEEGWTDGEVDSSCSGQPIHLWQFLKELLLKPHSYGRFIRWLNKEKGTGRSSGLSEGQAALGGARAGGWGSRRAGLRGCGGGAGARGRVGRGGKAGFLWGGTPPGSVGRAGAGRRLWQGRALIGAWLHPGGALGVWPRLTPPSPMPNVPLRGPHPCNVKHFKV